MADAHAAVRPDAVAAAATAPETRRGTRRTSSARRPGPSRQRSAPGRAVRRTRQARPACGCTGLPPTMASLEWNSRFRIGAPRSDDLARERDHVVRRAVRRPQPAHLRDARQPQHALGRVGPRRARIQALAQTPARGGSSAAEIGSSSTLLEPGSRRVVVGQKVRRERRAHEVRALLVRFVEQRRDRRVHQVARAFERRDVRGRKSEAARSIGHGPHADRRQRSPTSATPAAHRTARAAATARTDGASTSSGAEGRRFPRVVMRADLARRRAPGGRAGRRPIARRSPPDA